jgi:hypothetical protein
MTIKSQPKLNASQEAFIDAYGRSCAMVSEETLREYFRLYNAGENVSGVGLDSPDHITDCLLLFSCGVYHGHEQYI